MSSKIPTCLEEPARHRGGRGAKGTGKNGPVKDFCTQILGRVAATCIEIWQLPTVTQRNAFAQSVAYC